MNVNIHSWEMLPEEIWLNIFERLPLKAQVSLGCTCKKLYNISLDHFLDNAEKRAWLYLSHETPLPPLLASSIRVFLIPETNYDKWHENNPFRERIYGIDLDKLVREHKRRIEDLKKFLKGQIIRMENLRKLLLAGNQRTKDWGLSLADIYELVSLQDLEELKAPLSFFTYKDQKGWSLLHLAVSQGNRNLVSSILSQLERDLVDVEGYDMGRRTGNLVVIDRETLVNSKDVNGKTPLQIALDRKDRDMALFLLKKGCTANVYTLTRETSDLSFLRGGAFSYRSHLIVDFLADFPAFFKLMAADQKILSVRFSARFFQESFGVTSSEIGLEKDAKKIEWEKKEAFFRTLAEMLKENKTLLIVDLREYSRVEEGGEQKFLGEELKPLFECQGLEEIWFPPFFLNYLDALGQSPLHWAVAMGNKKLAQSLITQGVALSGKDHKGHTPLSLVQILPGDQTEMFSLLERAKNKKLAVAFGKREWERYFGPVDKEPPLPANILEILESPCPIWGERYPEKKVIDTHLLTLIPQKVNGKALTFNYLWELIPHPKNGGNKVEHGGGDDMSSVFYELGDLPSKCAGGSSHWILMTKDVLPNTKGKFYHKQWEEMERLMVSSRRFKAADYKLPQILDAAISIIMEYVRSGNMLYRDDAVDDCIFGTGTFCEEILPGGGVAAVGKISHRRIVIIDYRTDGSSRGLALMRLL